MKKLLIIGHARHGKDTVAEMIHAIYGYTFTSSSMAASKLFIYNQIKDEFGYTTPEQCFEDRVNHRDLWHDLICWFNKDDKARLAKNILVNSDVYVGMRDNEECEESMRQGLFDTIIGVFDPRKPLEPESSFNINIWEKSDFVIPNAGTLIDLRRKVLKQAPLLVNHYPTLKKAAA